MAYQPELEKLERRYAEEPAKHFAQLAEAYRRVGQVDKALDHLLMHLEERPNYVSALIVLGRCYVDKGLLTDAAHAFERVLSIDGENIIALKVLAEVAEHQGDVGQAQSWLTRLLEVDPMNEEAEAQLASLEQTPAAPAPAASEWVDDEAVAPAEDMVIERASTEVAPPVADEAAHRHGDLDLEAAPEPDRAVAEPVREAPSDEGFDEPLWSRDLEAPPAPAEPADDEVVSAGRPEASEDRDTVDVEPFDSELAWGTGDTRSGDISRDDPDEAERAHEDALEAPVQELPGLEHAEVPQPEASHEVAPADGLVSEAMARAAEEAQPLPGLEATDVGAQPVGDVAPDEPVADAGEEQPDAAEEFAPADDSRGSLAGLPVFMPESDDPDEADETDASSDRSAGPPVRPSVAAEANAEEAELEPVVTETMAELYARQGLIEEAREVYRRLLDARPDDERLQQRLGELERRRATPTAADPRARYEAARTGGVGARDFLRAVLEGRATTVVTHPPVEAAAPSPIEEAFGDEPLEPRGAPTRPASDQPSLANVFGEEAPARPSAPSPSPPSASGSGREGGFSFDEFFGDPSDSPAERPSGGEAGWAQERSMRPSGEEVDESDESFKAWLKGLKS